MSSISDYYKYSNYLYYEDIKMVEKLKSIKNRPLM